jgi:predicted permease
MQHIISALIPIFSLILIGYFFKKIKFPSNDFWASADKLTYYILMPSLLVYKLSTANLENLDALDFLFTGNITILVVLLLCILINIKLNTSGASFSSVVQGAVRFNTYVFLALISSVYGDEGLALGALLITFAIPLINVIAITIFAVYVNDKKVTFLGLVKSIVANPLIIACVLGGSTNYFDITMPIIVENTFKILSSAALPMGLLSVGFSLELKAIKDAKLDLFLAVFLKLFVAPVIMFLIGRYFNLDTIFLSIVVIFASMPTAPSGVVFARQLGGDVKLMAAIITMQTIVSMFTISVILGFLSI